jgi:hypothetical protein
MAGRWPYYGFHNSPAWKFQAIIRDIRKRHYQAQGHRQAAHTI